VDVIQASGIQQQERKLLRDNNLTTLLVHDLLFSRGIQAGDGPIKQAILKHKTRLNAELVKVQIKRGVVNKKDLAQTAGAAATSVRRWVRINTLRASEEETLSLLREARFEQIKTPEG
jgi:25S rRNA (cytosine2278-C5)-methyltransferase